jgi:hypothetical protein
MAENTEFILNWQRFEAMDWQAKLFTNRGQNAEKMQGVSDGRASPALPFTIRQPR